MRDRNQTSLAGSMLSDPWIVGAVVAALVLRLVRLDEAALWLDETDTARWIALPWGEMVRTVLSDNHAPLYFLVLKAWSTVAGASPWALRLASALAAWTLVPLTAAIAATLVGRSAARWAAWLAALSPYLLYHAQDARMYALVAALAAVHLLMLSRLLTARSRGLGAAFVLVALALVSSHYYTVFLLGGELLLLAILRPQPLRAWLPAAALTSLIAGGAVLTAMSLALRQGGGGYEMGALALPGFVWSLLSGYSLLPTSQAVHVEGPRAALPYLPIALLALPALLASGLLGLRNMSPRARVMVLVLLPATILGPFAAKLLAHVSINPRYGAAGEPLLLVLLAAAAPQRLRLDVRSVALLLLGATMVAGTAVHLAHPGERREDIYAAGAWLDAHVPVDEEILVTSGEMLSLAQFHWPSRRFRLYPGWGIVADDGRAPEIAAELPFPGPRRAIYLVGREWVSDPSGALQRALSDRYTTCDGAEVRGIHILCLVPPDSSARRGDSTPLSEQKGSDERPNT